MPSPPIRRIIWHIQQATQQTTPPWICVLISQQAPETPCSFISWLTSSTVVPTFLQGQKGEILCSLFFVFWNQEYRGGFALSGCFLRHKKAVQFVCTTGLSNDDRSHADLYYESAARGSNILEQEHPLITQDLGKPDSKYVPSPQMHLIHIVNMLTQYQWWEIWCVSSMEGP